jgi:hypothetical protein
MNAAKQAKADTKQRRAAATRALGVRPAPAAAKRAPEFFNCIAVTGVDIGLRGRR